MSHTSSQTPIVIEAELATLIGTATVVDCSTASGEKKVKNINDGPSNGLLFQNIVIEQSGLYDIRVSYFATNSRPLSYQINGEVTKTIIPTISVYPFNFLYLHQVHGVIRMDPREISLCRIR